MPASTYCPYCPPGTKEKRCKACGKCLKHAGCACRLCGICAKTLPPKALCAKCNRCKEHHVGPITGRISFPFRKCAYVGTSASGVATTNKLLGLNRAVGIELEISGGARALADGGDANPSGLGYRWEHDGSVTGGLELVCNHAAGDALYLGLQGLGTLMTKYRCTADTTCGFHVHVDAIDYTGLALRNVMVGYQLVQDQLYGRFVAPDRKASHFCKPYNLSTPDLHMLLGFHKNSDFTSWFYERFYNLKRASEGDELQARRQRLNVAHQLAEIKKKKYMNDARRYALNFHSYMMRGTLEYRLKEGTTDPDTILYWPIFCGFLTEALASVEPKALYHWLKEPPEITSLIKGRKAQGLEAWLKKKPSFPAAPVDQPQPDGNGYINQLAHWQELNTTRRLRGLSSQPFPIPPVGATLEMRQAYERLELERRRLVEAQRQADARPVVRAAFGGINGVYQIPPEPYIMQYAQQEIPGDYEDEEG